MGLLNIFRKKKRGGKISINNSCFIDGTEQYPFSNCLIAGTKSAGRDSLLRELTIDALNNNGAVFIIQNGTSLPNNTLKNELSNGCGNRAFFGIDFGMGGFTAPVNMFKGGSTDFVQELLLLLMESYRNVSPDTKSFVERYLNEVLSLYKIQPTKKFLLSNITDFDEQWISNEANRLFSIGAISSDERDRSLKYANNLVLYRKEYNEYENFCLEIQRQNFAKSLSGSISYSQLNSSNYVTFINLDNISFAKQSVAFLKLFIHKAIREMRNTTQKTTFVFEDVDVSQIPEFRELLKSCQTCSGNNVYFTIDRISDFLNSGYDPRSYSNTYFVFRQPIMSEAEEWAKTSGTHKKDKVTQQTSPYDQIYGEQNQGLIGSLVNFKNRNTMVLTGEGHETIDEYNMLPEEFMQLPEKASKLMIQTRSGFLYQMQVTWP